MMHYIRLLAVILLFFTALQTQTNCFGKNKNPAGVKIGVGKMEGHTTYSIGGYVRVLDNGNIISGYVHDPLSRLEFSLNFDLAKIGLEYQTPSNWSLLADYGFNIMERTEKMKDSDWGIDGDAPSTLSIYSESDSTINASILSFSALKKINPEDTLQFMIGANYLLEHFDYEVFNVSQYSPSGLPGYSFKYSGNALDYEVTYSIFSVEARIETNFDIMTFQFGYSYSLSANAEDRDNHILRSKVSTSKAKGTASNTLFLLELMISSQSSLLFEYQYRRIDLNGVQTQTTDGKWSADIDNRIYSDQKSTSISYKFRF